MSFLFLVSVVLVFSTQQVCVFFLAIESFRTIESTNRKKVLVDSQYNYLESVHPTDYVVFRTCRLIVSSSFGQSQSYILDRFCGQILMNRFYLDVKTGPN